MVFTYAAADEAGTEALGVALAALLQPGAVVALCGPLGAGKTRLVQAIAAAAGIVDQEVVSPTFVLIHEYRGRVPIYHFDAYRLRDEDEFLQLGPEEYFEGRGWSLVEWADRVPSCMPVERLEIRIEPTGANSRRFTINGFGGQYEVVVASLENSLRRR